MLAPKPEAEMFRANVRARCEALGMNQTALAVAVGVTPAAISQILSGATEPKLSTAFRIAHALKCSIEDLVVEHFDPTLHANVLQRAV